MEYPEDFEQWWEDEGSQMEPHDEATIATFTKRVAWEAWEQAMREAKP